MDVTDLLKGSQENGIRSDQKDSIWRVQGSHLISRFPNSSFFKKHCDDHFQKGIKIAAFDMDDTLICTKSGIKFGRGPLDWKWRTPEVLPTLEKKVRDQKYVMVIFTNQASISVTSTQSERSKSYRNLQTKVDMMARSLQKELGSIQLLVFASAGRPGMSVKNRSSIEQHFGTRKPECGMWRALEAYIRRVLGDGIEIDKSSSFYVGDAAGRPGDHSADDLHFAKNVGLEFYEPEQFFGS